MQLPKETYMPMRTRGPLLKELPLFNYSFCFPAQAPLCKLQDGQLPAELKQRLEDEASDFAAQVTKDTLAKIQAAIKVGMMIKGTECSQAYSCDARQLDMPCFSISNASNPHFALQEAANKGNGYNWECMTPAPFDMHREKQMQAAGRWQDNRWVSVVECTQVFQTKEEGA
eukprot:1156104-Pelagomonas_calceolata.AAC.1